MVHLESCAVCREEVAALQVVAPALPAVAPLLAPGELKRRVMGTVRQEASLNAPAAARQQTPRARSRWLGWRPALAGAAAMAVVAAILAVVLSSGGGGGQAARVIDAKVLAPHASATLRVSEGHAELDVVGMPQTETQPGV